MIRRATSNCPPFSFLWIHWIWPFCHFFSVNSAPSVYSVLNSISFLAVHFLAGEIAQSVTPASRKIRATVAAISGAPGVSP
jgi:hypothetical protein